MSKAPWVLSLLCGECEDQRDFKPLKGRRNFLANALVNVDKPRYRALLHQCLERIPESGRPVRLQAEVRLRRHGTLPGVVGLTTFCVGGYAPNGVAAEDSGAHTITFYTHLMDRLSDEAVLAVMAHELAHAWLNEHLCPEASKAREDDADMVAEMWGFESELAALAAETEPIS
jgi:Zn-dependent protease with chaperone function